MIKFVASFFLFTFTLFAVTLDSELENTNILSKQENEQTQDTNRFRIYTTFEDEKYEDFLLKLIMDNTNTYSITNNDNTNKTEFYRGYLKYSGEIHQLVVGLQRIPFGVGRVWNPIDIFNPIDSTSIETSQRKGVEALRYEYAIDELSNIDITYSKDKSSVRIKGFLEFADVALVGLKDDENDLNILGYEIEGELLDTGIELRSEGGRFNKDYSEYILGAEYGFENSLNVLIEYKNNTKIKIDYLGAVLTYQPTMLLNLGFRVVKNKKDDSSFMMPSAEYSLSDDMNLNIGMFKYSGTNQSEYGSLENSYFIKLFVHF